MAVTLSHHAVRDLLLALKDLGLRPQGLKSFLFGAQTRHSALKDGETKRAKRARVQRAMVFQENFAGGGVHGQSASSLMLQRGEKPAPNCGWSLYNHSWNLTKTRFFWEKQGCSDSREASRAEPANMAKVVMTRPATRYTH